MIMNELIKQDLFRYAGNTSVKSFIKTWSNAPGFRFLYVFRKCSTSKNSLKKLFWRIVLRYYTIKFGIQISYRTKIGKGLHLAHWGNIILSSKTTIGDNCYICQGVTIGKSFRGKKMGHPTIGDEVFVGPNSIIVGNVKIGNNVLIAPLAYVNFDVPDNSIVLGNPGKIIPKENAVEHYIINIV
jgi:serine O-acetyltransferase